MKENVSIIMPIHNQEDIISQILKGVIDNVSLAVKEFILIMDGNTDRTEAIVTQTLEQCKTHMKIRMIYTPDVWETKACNVGFKIATGDYIINFQDDMLIQEKDFDQRFLKPFRHFSNVFAVTARDAQDVKIGNVKPCDFFNLFGKDANSPRDLFGVRDIVNRGPIMFDHNKLQEIDYLDEIFAPLGQDDTDICFRAWRKGWISGAYGINYVSDLKWGQTRKNPISGFIRDQVEIKNLKILFERHKDLIEAPKHGTETYLP